MVNQYEETGEETGFRGGLRLGWSRSAFRLFLISLMLRLPVAVLMLLLIGPLITFAVLAFASGPEPAIALGIMLAGVFVGIAIVVASAIR